MNNFKKICVCFCIFFSFLGLINFTQISHASGVPYKTELDAFLQKLENNRTIINDDVKYINLLNNLSSQLESFVSKFSHNPTLVVMIQYLQSEINHIKNSFSLESDIEKKSNTSKYGFLDNGTFIDPGFGTYKPYKDKDIYIVDYRGSFPGCTNRGVGEPIKMNDLNGCIHQMRDFLYFDGEKYSYARDKPGNIYAIRISTSKIYSSFSISFRNRLGANIIGGLNVIGSISKIPGKIEENCKTTSFQTFAINSKGCQNLSPGENYYFNFHFLDNDRMSSNILITFVGDIKPYHAINKEKISNTGLKETIVTNTKEILKKDDYYKLKYLYSSCNHKEKTYFYKNIQGQCISASFNCEGGFLKYSIDKNSSQDFPYFNSMLFDTQAKCESSNHFTWIKGNNSVNEVFIKNNNVFECSSSLYSKIGDNLSCYHEGFSCYNPTQKENTYNILTCSESISKTQTDSNINKKDPYIWSKAPSFGAGATGTLCSNTGINYNSTNSGEACNDEGFVCHTQVNKGQLLRCIKNTHYSPQQSITNSSTGSNNSPTPIKCDHIASYLTGCVMD